MIKIGRDQHLKLSPQSHISFYKVLFEKEHSKPPLGKDLWQELFMSPVALIFFSDPPFSKFGTVRNPAAEGGGADIVESDIAL